MGGKFLAINQDYDIVETNSFRFKDEATNYMAERFNKEVESMREHKENIIEESIDRLHGVARLFYEYNGEVLGYAMYVV
jgi:hypothetical protein